MTTTIDSAGRIVVPKAIRDAAGLGAGQHVDVELADGRIVISAPWMRTRLEERHGIFVMVPDEPVPAMAASDVQAVIEQTREQRGRS